MNQDAGFQINPKNQQMGMPHGAKRLTLQMRRSARAMENLECPMLRPITRLLPKALIAIRRFALWLWLGVALGSGAAVAQPVADHITERAWLEDPTGQLTWPDVTRQAMQPFEGVLSQGFGSGVIWLRLRIDPQAGPTPKRDPESLILRIRPVYLDDIQVFDPLVPGGWVGTTGDLQHPRGQTFEGLDFMLPLARGDAARDVWLRMESTSTRQIAVQALHYEDLQRLTQTQQLIFALYIGLILVFMVWGVVYWGFSQEPVIGAFGLKQATALVYALASLGYSRVYWPAGWPAYWLDVTTSLFSCIAVSAAIHFHVLLLREFRPPHWIRHVHRIMLWILPIKLLMLTDHTLTMYALRINMLEVMLAPPVFLLSALLATGWKTNARHSRPLLPRWTVLGFYGLLTLILLVAALPGLGLTRGGEIPLYVVQAHGLLTAFLVLLMLQYRAQIQLRQQHETAMALERSDLKAKQERRIREEQEKLLAMLAHELKTPLATMQMRLDLNAPGSREVRSAMRDMNAIIERSIQTTQLADHQLQAHITPVDLASLIKDAISSCAHPERIQFHQAKTVTLPTDRQLLFIALGNLLENACKYGAAQSAVDVWLICEADCARIEVCNPSGSAGWPDAGLVFQKYYRSPHARRQAGTGLGLYLVRNLMKVLGGDVEYRPDARQICFVLTLPLDASSA